MGTHYWIGDYFENVLGQDGKVAKTVANEIGNNCEAIQIQTLHNVSLDDFNNGETWVSLMNKNVEVLRKALQ